MTLMAMMSIGCGRSASVCKEGTTLVLKEARPGNVEGIPRPVQHGAQEPAPRSICIVTSVLKCRHELESM